jgi:hypothetical protein
VTGSPFSRTAANCEVVAALSVPIKMFPLMVACQIAESAGKGKNYSPFTVFPV